MGYRSEVRCVIGFDEQTKFEIFVGMLKGTKLAPREGYGPPEGQSIIEEWGGCWSFYRAEKMIQFHHGDVKWYEWFPEIQDFHAMLEQAEMAGGEYKFIRIGEESDDIEQKDGGEGNIPLYDFLSLRQSIVCELGDGEPA